METVNIFKAQRIGQHMIVGSVTIVIDEELPEQKTIEDNEAIFQKEAFTLADALLKSLPGGTIDRLVAELLRRKATSFVVPLFGRETYKLQPQEVQLSEEERHRIAKILIDELDRMPRK